MMKYEYILDQIVDAISNEYSIYEQAAAAIAKYRELYRRESRNKGVRIKQAQIAQKMLIDRNNGMSYSQLEIKYGRDRSSICKTVKRLKRECTQIGKAAVIKTS